MVLQWPGTHVLQLYVEFQLVIGGRESVGGDGVTVSYGAALPIHLLGEFGGGSGLRVQFLTNGHEPRIEVHYDAVRLGSAPCANLRSGHLTRASITAESAGVSVRYDGQLLLGPLPWGHLGWAPQPDWQLAFSAASGFYADNHWVDDLRIQTGTNVADTVVPVSVALNGQQFVDVAEGLPYAFEAVQA